ncbi:MAG TPA: ABC transporter permease [Vicinamibacterales bacterium]
MTALRQDLAYAFRAFLKAPGFTAIAVLVLGIGIGANTAIFSLVNELLFKPLSGRAGELVGVYSRSTAEGGAYRAFSYPNYVDVRDESGVFDALMAHTFAMVGVPAGDTTRRTFVDVVSANYFETLGVQLAAGRPFTRAEEQPGARIPVAIVPYARRHEVGQTIRINAQDFTIVGAAPEGFTGTMVFVGPELYLPLGVFDNIVNDTFKNNRLSLADRANPALVLAGRLRNGVSPELAAGRLAAFSRLHAEAYPAENRDQLLSTNPLSRVATSTSPQNDSALVAFSALLMGLSGVVLIIACLNIANMLLARGTARAKEVALRLALGAGRARVIRQLLTEGIVLAAAGGACGLLLSYLAASAFASSITAALPLRVTFSPTPDVRVLALTMALAAVATVAFGLGPALRLSRRDLVRDLKERGTEGASGGRRFSARNIMVVAQVSLSLALLTAGGIFARTSIAAAQGDPGHPYDGMAVASLDGSLAGYDETGTRKVYAAVLDRVRRAPGVTAAGLASSMPFGDTHESSSIERVGAPGKTFDGGEYRIIGSDYFAALGLRMVRGREFSRAEEESPDAPRAVIVDEILARRVFGGEDPIGQMIRVAPRPGEPLSEREEPMQIVGVAPPLRSELLQSGPVAHMFVPSGRHFRAGMFLQARFVDGADGLAGVETLRREIRAADPALPILALSTMQAFHERGLELWMLRTGARMFTALGVIALLLAVVGLYGVKSYVVSLRTREIGIRMALGATTRDVLRQMLTDGMMLTAAGILVGVPLAALVSIAMSSVFVEIGGFDALVVAAATAMLAAAATIATVIPSRRAARIEPLNALRAE